MEGLLAIIGAFGLIIFLVTRLLEKEEKAHGRWWHIADNARLDKEVKRGLAVQENHAVLVSVRALIAKAEEEANDRAADELRYDNKTLIAGYVGAAQQLRALDRDIMEKRKEGLAELAQ